MYIQSLVEKFHKAFGVIIRKDATALMEISEASLREILITEEYKEVIEEFNHEQVDVPKLAKELADLVYVCYGTALTYGFDLDKVIQEVHNSNMSKLDGAGKPIKNEHGKVMKGPNYQEPDIAQILNLGMGIEDFSL